VATIAKAAESVSGVITKSYVPPIADHTPTLDILWDTDKIHLTGAGLLEALRNGNPSIEAYGGGKNSITVSPWMMRPEQVKIVAGRIKEELKKASVQDGGTREEAQGRKPKAESRKPKAEGRRHLALSIWL
jgi:L-seryl-tRNA(Ser) seleniumtransferase